MTFDIKSFTTTELLQYYGQIIDELKTRKVVRTANSPIGDYAEWLVANKLGLKLMTNSTQGYDAEDSSGIKYQIKCRRMTRINQSVQLSAIRNLHNADFDYLIVVLFNKLVEVERVLKIPHQIIDKYARYRKHVNAHILIIRENVLLDPQVEDLTKQFCN